MTDTPTAAPGQPIFAKKKHTHTTSDVTGSGINPNPVDDPADPSWGSNLGYDYEFGAVTTSLPAGWSWVNQGTASYSELFGAGVVLHLGAAADDVKAIVRAVPTESSFTATIKCAAASLDNNFRHAGICLRDSVSGKLAVWTGSRTGRTVSLELWTNPTTFSSTVGSDVVHQPPSYLRLKKNGAWSSVDFDFSTDGVGWVNYRAAYNLSGGFFTPDQIGFHVFRNGTDDIAGSVHWFRVR